MADLLTSFVFRHHFWCFPFYIYIYKKIQNITTKRNLFEIQWCFIRVSKTGFLFLFICISTFVFVLLFLFLSFLQSLTYWQSIQYFTTEQDWNITFDLSNQIKACILYPIREVNWKLASSKQHNKPMVWRELSDFSCALTWASTLGDGRLCWFIQLDVDHWECSVKAKVDLWICSPKPGA